MNIEIRSPSKIEKWIYLFQHLENFGENVNLLFYSDRFYLQTMDKNRSAVCEVFLPGSWFDLYVLHSSYALGGVGKYLSLGVNVAMMTRILKILNNRTLVHGGSSCCGDGRSSIKKRMILVMKYARGSDSIELGIRIFSILSEMNSTAIVPALEETPGQQEEVEETQTFGFEIPLVFLDEERMDIPTDTDYTAEIRLNAEWMSELIKTLKGFGDNVCVDCSEDELAFTASDVEHGLMRVPIHTDQLLYFSIVEGAVVNMVFRLKILYVASLFHKMSKIVVIRMSEERPLQFVYWLENPNTAEDAGEDAGEEMDPDARLVFYLVPCIEENNT